MYIAKFMEQAMELAALGKGAVSPNPMVGAVVVRHNQVVGLGYHRRAGTEHGEILALQMAGELARDADLYVTLEPCSHYGQTPPCVEAIIRAGIKNVYVGVIDPNPLVAGKGIEILRKHGIHVEVGFMEEELKEQNRFFFHWISTGLPYVNLKYAMTMDGKIATYTGDSKWITNEKARGFVQELRQQVDGILVGINTVLKDNPRLTCRIDDHHKLYKIICDDQLRCPLEAEIIKKQPELTILATISEDEEKIKRYTDLGVTVLQCKAKDGQVDLQDLLIKLGQRKITSLLVEGGSAIHSSFVKEQLVNRVYAFMAPKIMGGGQSPTVGQGSDTMEEIVTLNNVQIKTMEDNILFYGDFPQKERGEV